MNFIISWTICSIVVFVLEMILKVGGKLIANFFNFAFDNEITMKKIKRMLFFSIIAGIILAF